MKPIQIDDITKYEFFGNLKEKENHVVFMMAKSNMDTNGYNNYLMGCWDNEIHQLSQIGYENSFIFKNGEEIYYLSKSPDKEKTTVLHSMNLFTRITNKLLETELTGLQLIGLCDAKTILASGQVDLAPDDEDYEVVDELPFYINAQGFVNKKRNQLFLINLEDQTVSQSITQKEMDVTQSIIHEGKIYYTGQTVKNIRSLDFEGIYEYDLKSKETRSLIGEDELEIHDMKYMDNGLILMAADTKTYGLNENPKLYRLDLSDGSLSLLYDWQECLGNTVGTDCALLGGNSSLVYKDSYYFTSTIIDHVNLYKYSNEGLEKALDWPGTINSFSVNEKGIDFIGAKPNETQQLYHANGSHIEQISDFNPDLKDCYVAKAQPISFTSPSGLEMTGYVLYPKDYDSNRSYPAILDVHGGPKTVYGTVFYHEMQVWASQGYFVLFCNPTGSDGRGNTFMDIRGKYGSIDYDDIMTFVDTVLKEIPQIDKNRLGVTGGSYGGFMTNWIIGHTNRFSAAASQRSISNWISFYGTSDIGPSFTKDQQDADLKDLDSLWSHSPLKYADQAETPTLFIHSDEDYRCPLEQGMQMYSKLKENGIDSRMVIFHKENHELSRSGRPKHRLRRLEEITNWMNKYLKNPS